LFFPFSIACSTVSFLKVHKTKEASDTGEVLQFFKQHHGPSSVLAFLQTVRNSSLLKIKEQRRACDGHSASGLKKIINQRRPVTPKRLPVSNGAEQLPCIKMKEQRRARGAHSVFGL